MKPLDLKHSLNTNNKIIKHRKTSCKNGINADYEELMLVIEMCSRIS